MKKLILTLFTIGLFFTAQGTHLRAGEIIARRVNCTSLTFKITVRVYTDRDSPVDFGGNPEENFDVLDFGDGTKFFIPTTPSIPLAGFSNVGFAEYTIDHTFPNPGTFTISYREPNRNSDVLNMINSVQTTFYTETQITIDPAFGCFDYGHNFLAPPLFTINAGSPTSISLIATSYDNVFNVYNLVACKQDRNRLVNSYVFPETASIDPYTGLFTWDGKFNRSVMLGDYNFAVMVSHYIQINGEFIKIGHTVRDFQIVVTEELSTGIVIDNAVLNENKGIIVGEEMTKQFRVFAETIEGSIQSIDLFSEIPDFVTMQQYDSMNGPKRIKIARVSLTNNASISRDAPYAITVRTQFNRSSTTRFEDRSYLFFTKETDFPNAELITEVTEGQVSPLLYPNPTSGIFNISSLNGEYTIYNMNGQMVIRGFALQEVNVSFLSAGVYYIVYKSKSSATSSVHRFIKN